MLNKTLEEIEKDYWPLPPTNSSSLIIKCHELRKKKIKDLGPEDYRLLIGQNISLEIIIPITIGILKDEAFIEASFFPGDLLLSTLKVNDDFWKKNNSLKKEIVKIFTDARENLQDHHLDEDIINELNNEYKKLT